VFWLWVRVRVWARAACPARRDECKEENIDCEENSKGGRGFGSHFN
jgi:hypothetical protein